jgi:hypothetical protein
MYTLELVKAINDWQFSGTGKIKSKIAKRIQEHSIDLPSKFKTFSSQCYRRVDLVGKHSLEIGTKLSLPETFSSWSFDKSVAKEFDGGVPPKGYQGVIFELTPEDNNHEVIINLNELFKDQMFIQACNENKDKIKNYDKGIGFYGNDEKELILNVSELKINQIWAYGGYSSTKDEIAEKFFGHKPTKNEIVYFNRLVKQRNISFGASWITGDAKNRTIEKHILFANLLTK